MANSNNKIVKVAPFTWLKMPENADVTRFTYHNEEFKVTHTGALYRQAMSKELIEDPKIGELDSLSIYEEKKEKVKNFLKWWGVAFLLSFMIFTAFSWFIAFLIFFVLFLGFSVSIFILITYRVSTYRTGRSIRREVRRIQRKYVKPKIYTRDWKKCLPSSFSKIFVYDQLQYLELVVVALTNRIDGKRNPRLRRIRNHYIRRIYQCANALELGTEGYFI